MTILRDTESCHKALTESAARKVSFVYHLKIRDVNGYDQWLNEPISPLGGKRLFRVKVDPVARDGMLVDEIVIDEFSSIPAGLQFMSAFEDTLGKVCSEHSVLVIKPEPAIVFWTVKVISWFVRLFKGVSDTGVPAATWQAENSAVWPDEQQMRTAREQDLDEPLFVYNLNKYKPVAEYKEAKRETRKISGKEAYDRYSKIAGFELLRRGAYPVYGGRPLCLLSSRPDCMLADSWDRFIFVRYPQRRNLLAILESEEFHRGEVHRDAGLERVALFMARQA